ncbi:Protein kinase C-like 1, partial [Coemansia sp. S85]
MLRTSRLLATRRLLPLGYSPAACKRLQYSHAARSAEGRPRVHANSQGSLSSWLHHSGLLQRSPALRNAGPALLYQNALRYEPGTAISSTGALIATSGKKTGRSPRDKRVVEEASTVDDVWWGPVNKKLSEESFSVNYERAVNYLNTRERLYVFDGYAGWDPKYRIKVRVVCARAYHALFMNNMLIRPTQEELETFGEPDFTIFNAGQCAADPGVEG